ncbi:MAG: NUDIX hydrolase [Minisyncoccia bacterium]|jgi:8-oxo-dGTP pyrophosphatase MutT (NUDIX family)
MRLEEYGLGEIKDWASLVFARVLPAPKILAEGEKDTTGHISVGFVFIIEPKKRDPKWKLSGGHRKREDEIVDITPIDTAVREFAGETGITLSASALTYVGKQLGWRGDHWRCLFHAILSLDDIAWMNTRHPENEGEEPKFFKVEEFYQCVREGKFLQKHFDWLVETGLILPGTRHLKASA